MSIKIDRDKVEFLGIEIIFTGESDPRGSVWIPVSESVSLLYGKNGSGKSTILSAISSFINGQSQEDDGILVHGYFRPLDPRESCSLFQQAIDSMPNTGFLNDWEELEVAEIRDKFSAMASNLEFPHSKWEQSLFSPVPESVDDLDMDWNKFVSHFLFLGLWDQDIRYDLNPLRGFIGHLVDERIICLRASGNVEAPKWELTLAARVDSSEVRASYEALLDEPEFLDDEEEVPENYVGQILMDANILANRSRMPRTNSPFIATAALSSQTISSIGMKLCNLNDEVDLSEWTMARVAEIIHSTWISVSDPWFSDYPTHRTPTSPFDSQTLNYQGDDEDVEDDELSETEPSPIWSVSFGSTRHQVIRTIDFELNSEREETLQRTLTFIAKELPSELAISDLRIQFNPDLGLWIYGKPATLEAFDQRSQSWIPVSDTSNATQRIIGMALQIHAEIRSSDQLTIAVGDEVDNGLHSLAMTGLYQMLTNSIPACFLTSHSSVALASRFGERIHVQRGVLGEVQLRSLNNADFNATSANNLGVRANELIGSVDLILAVEGEHDKKVFDHYIKQDSRLAGCNILIMSMTGLNNSTNLIDAEFLLSFTDLRILAIADNVSKADLASTYMDTLSKLQSGASPAKVSAGLRKRSRELQNQKWYEQRRMVDLLAFATERNLLQRLRVSGHTYFDIEAALPPELFGLNKDWLELEAEYRLRRDSDNSQRITFKEYVRSEYGVSIDTKSIGVALEMTAGVPSGIQLVLDDIVTLLDELLWNSSLI